MNVLVIWDQCGAGPIELWNATGEMAALALQCHERYINSDGDCDALDQLSNELGNNQELTKLTATDKGYLFFKGYLFSDLYDAIIVCGFIP